jgi:hypothetical protein
VFETSPAPIADMVLTLYPNKFKQVSQNVKIYTDVERSYNQIICPITAQLVPTKLFALLAADFTNITIDGQFTTLADAGEYFFDLRVENPSIPNQYTDYRFKVVLRACYVNQLTFGSTIPDISYDTTLGTLTTSSF